MRYVLFALWLAVAGVAAAQTACTTDAQCADGNACNGTERCLGGFCQPGTPPSCNDDNLCTLDQCDPLAGCQHAPVVNGTSCSDGNACNGPETCRNGACVRGTPPADGTSCNTGNPCTNADSCQAGTCVAGPARPDGAGCSDGNECNGRETCVQGVCTAGTAPADGTACGDGDPCDGADTCQSGACVTGPVPPEGSPCSDGVVCNGQETCHLGVCTSGAPAPNGTPCADANLCDGTETCQDGVCRAGTPLDCDDHNPCTNDSCGNAVGCKHVERTVGASCDDGDVCNGIERCQAGAVCAPGTPPVNGTSCEDANPCNGTETCVNGACVAGTPWPDGTSCSDGDVCNGAETCQAGICKPGTAPVCDDGNPCTKDVCQALVGCQFPPEPNGTACGDDNVCNGADTCTSGVCTTGPAPVCDDGDPATPDVCDPIAGCTVDAPIAGDLLKLVDAGSHGTTISARTKGTIDLSDPPAAGSARDPVQHGAVLRIRSAAAGFDQRFALPRTGWAYLGDPNQNRGYRYVGRGRSDVVRSVVVRDGRIVKLSGRGPNAGPGLATDPAPVDVVLILGNTRYCMLFGGRTSLAARGRFIAVAAPAPGSCPP